MKMTHGFWVLVGSIATVSMALGAPAVNSAEGAKTVVSARPVSFVHDVQPILTKLGCNQGACHGASSGKGGFRLSLRGFDDNIDFFEIVKNSKSRRILRSDPENSLLLTKPTLEAPHRGGKRLEKGSLAYETLLRWIEEGAAGPNSSERRFERMDVTPAEKIMSADEKITLRVKAIYSDGTEEPVEAKASFDSQTPQVAEVDAAGHVVAKSSGETAIMVRYLGHVGVSRILVPYRAEVPVGAFKPNHFVDELWMSKWRQLGLRPSPPCSDAEFQRRLWLDVLGTLPSPDAIQAFLADTDPDKRAKLVDKALQQPEYVDYWAYKWGDLLRSNRDDLEEKGMWALHNWLRACFRDNKPMDQFVREILTAVGSPYQNGPANFYRVGNNPGEWAENSAQVFLGIRIQCARCHHHPFENISQKDFNTTVGFFGQVSRKRTNDFGLFGNDNVIYVRENDQPNAKTTQITPLGGKLGGKAVTEDLLDKRKSLADWMMDPENPAFARNIVNRYWGYLFGRGLIHPIDDIRSTNIPSNQAVLDSLAIDFANNGYDVKRLVRLIVTSQVYQTSAVVDPLSRVDGENRYFTHYTAKRLTAEQLMDAIDFACGTREKYAQLPLGYRAISLPDSRVASKFMDIFGRPKREINCECERGDSPNMAQALQLLGGNLLNQKVGDSKGFVAKLVADKVPPAKAVTEIYLRTVSRPPTATEVETAVKLVQAAGNPKIGYEDLLWTMLNTREFQFNH